MARSGREMSPRRHWGIHFLPICGDLILASPRTLCLTSVGDGSRHVIRYDMTTRQSRQRERSVQHNMLTTEEVWAEVKAVAEELYQDYVELNELDLFTLIPDVPAPVDMKRNWDVPVGLEIRGS